jgi:putative ABC transport system permease protein
VSRSGDHRWFRWLLRILPLDFRSDYGRDMEQVFRDQHREAAARGRMSVWRVWMANAGALLAIGPREHAAQFLQDVRYACRGMRANPGFAAATLAMIALGTGANAAMFSVIDAMILRSPFPDSERVALLRVAQPGKEPTAAIPLDQYRSLQDSVSAFETVGAIGVGGRMIVGGLGELRTMNVECITASLFRVLGAAPVSGRTFTDDEDRPGGPGAVVLSYQFWRRDLAGAPNAVGRVLTVNGVPSTIVGIMPRSFGGPYSRNNNDGWLPAGPGLEKPSPAGCTARSLVTVFVRLKPGSTSAAVPSPLSLMAIDSVTIGDYRTPLLSLLGAVGLVLLIACANVANLQLERVFGRRREMAVRMAIGATRSRIVRQTLTENLLLYVGGCAGGLLAASWTLHVLVGLLPGNMPHVNAIEMNDRILAATLGIACAAGLAVGLLPALQASSPDLVDDLRISAGTTRRAATRIRTALVVAQIALSLVLLVGAALLIRTFLTLRPSSPGFTAGDKLTAFIRLQGPHPPAAAAFFSTAFERIRTIPGVQGVAGSTYLPMSGSYSSTMVLGGQTSFESLIGRVTPNYFAEMQIPLARGRPFGDRDGPEGLPIVIVNEEMVRRLPHGEGVPGAPLRLSLPDGRVETRQIVGIVRNTRSFANDTRSRPEIYVPFAQSPGPFLNFIVRTQNPSDQRLWSAIRQAVAAIDPSQVADRLQPMPDLLDARVKTWRFGAWVLGLFAGMALALAAVGLAASIASWVAQRTREIGVRMALGAETGQVIRMFLRQGLALTTAGIVLGLAGAAASTRLLESWLYGVKPLDAPTFAWSAVGMLAIAALASYLPARRAARIDPLVTLRAE